MINFEGPPQIKQIEKPTEQIGAESERNNYQSLKEELLKGSISLEQVRDKLVTFDQETASRDASESNLVFLRDTEIVDFVGKHLEANDSYQRLLSFTEFHVGQRRALEAVDTSIEHFKNALENAKDASWAAYIEGTLLYMQGKEISEDIISKATDGRNSIVLRNLNEGLKSRGSPSYTEDYYKLTK